MRTRNALKFSADRSLRRFYLVEMQKLDVAIKAERRRVNAEIDRLQDAALPRDVRVVETQPLTFKVVLE